MSFEPAVPDTRRRRMRGSSTADIGKRLRPILVTSLLTGQYETHGHVVGNLPNEVASLLRELASEWARANVPEGADAYERAADIQISGLSHTLFQDEAGMWRASVLVTYRFM